MLRHPMQSGRPRLQAEVHMRTPRLSNIALCAVILGLSILHFEAAQAAPSSTRTSAYIVPLVRDFVIYRRNLEFHHADRGLFELSQKNGLSSFHTLVPSIKSIAVNGSLIVGQTDDGFFLLNANAPDPRPDIFKTRGAWQAALATRGLSEEVSLTNPDILAAALPNSILRPWEYRMMAGRLFGLTDEDSGGVLGVSGWFLSLVIGLRWKRSGSMLPISILIGTMTNVVGQMVLGGGGGAAFVGIVGEPLICWAFAGIGLGIAKIIAFCRSRWEITTTI